MPGQSNAPIGNVAYNFLLRVSVPTGAALAAGTQERTYSVPGLRLGDFVSVSKPSFQNTISVGNARVSAAGTLAIEFVVVSGTPSLTAEDYLIEVMRAGIDNAPGGLPTAIA